MKKLKEIRLLLKKHQQKSNDKTALFYKTGAGDYAEHDQFIGVRVPDLRKIAKEFAGLTLAEMQSLIESPINEERLLCLLILVQQYQNAEGQTKDDLYHFYMGNLNYVNNWNLVDASAHLIVGAHLLTADKSVLLALAKSQIMWQRRIAIVATWYFIRSDQLGWTFKIAELLLNDPHDLIHKAIGWMLREAGKRNQEMLIAFLDQYGCQMPRTMLRYAIEKFPEPQRQEYLKRKGESKNCIKRTDS
ncbi:MAG: DNA alkylation repair protein [Pseudomonadota bacterium]